MWVEHLTHWGTQSSILSSTRVPELRPEPDGSRGTIKGFGGSSFRGDWRTVPEGKGGQRESIKTGLAEPEGIVATRSQEEKFLFSSI